MVPGNALFHSYFQVNSTNIFICTINMNKKLLTLKKNPFGHFSPSSNNHLTWQCSISLCTCAPSPKCLDGRASRVCRPRHHNLMERNPGVKIKNCIFSDILQPSCSYESIRSCTSSLKFAALKFPRKLFETFSKDCHAAFSLSLNTASNCWSLKFV